MSDELHYDFGVSLARIAVIPYGINNATPMTAISDEQARKQLGLLAGPGGAVLRSDRAIQGSELSGSGTAVRVFGRPCTPAGDRRQSQKRQRGLLGRPQGISEGTGAVRASSWRIEHIPDADVELYFKSADVLVMPYTNIFQSGVLFLAFSFGVPVIATDVGALWMTLSTEAQGCCAIAGPYRFAPGGQAILLKRHVHRTRKDDAQRLGRSLTSSIRGPR